MVLVTMGRVTRTSIYYYWGEGGKYGPFDIQQEGPWAGWPNVGQVMRYFRNRADLTGPEFGKLYGEKVNADGKAIGEGWIYDMETQNEVPVDIGKRKIIIELLGIPPMLFGLAALEDGTLIEASAESHPVIGGQSILKRVKTDIEVYEANLRTRWQLYAISDAGGAMPAINADLQQLEGLAQNANIQGDYLTHVRELLFSNYYLASSIVENKRQYSEAYFYANNAARVAEVLNDSDLVATALFQRGFSRLLMGLYGKANENGIFVVDQALLKKVVQDFEDAKKNAHPQLRGRVMLKLGRAQAHLDAEYDSTPTLNKAERLVGKSPINDPYIRQLVTGGYSGFHEGRYLSDSAVLLNTAGDPGEALKNIESLKKLNQNTFGKDQRPAFAWIDIIAAESHLQLRQYDQAADLALQALKEYLGLRFSAHIAIIGDLYGRLLETRYRNSTQVVRLGEMLRTGSTML